MKDIFKNSKYMKKWVRKDNFIIRIDKDSKKITQFPRELRLRICIDIYNLLKKDSSLSDDSILNKTFLGINSSIEMNKNFPIIIKEIKEKKQNPIFKEALLIYFLDLIKIIRKLKGLNDTKKKLNQRELIKELISQNVTLRLSSTYLKEFIRDLIRELRGRFIDFNPIGKFNLNYKDLQRIARKKKGFLLTSKKKFKIIKKPPSHAKFLWQCRKKHKPFLLSPAKIMNNDMWCPKCSKKRPLPWTYDRLKKLAKERGLEKNGIEGKLNTPNHVYLESKRKQPPNRTKYEWSCQIEGHKPWKARPDSIKDGSWCPTCSKFSKLTYEQMIKLARDKGIESTGKPGKFLATKEEFNNINKKSKTHFPWQCGEGHKHWQSTPSNIKLGRWCPECAEGTSERIARYYFECIFNAPFPKSSPKWLEKLTGRKLHLDGYNERLGLAFEFNGIQHYEPVYGFKKLLIQQELDSLKKWACKKKPITLIIIPYDFDGRKDFVDYDKMQAFIISEYEKKTGKKLPKQPKFDYRTRDIKRLDEF